jgi:hypothetical protein
VQTRERTDDLQMAELFGANVHEEVLAFRILTVEPLNRYCMAAASSPFAPPNCSRSMLPNFGSGISTRTCGSGRQMAMVRAHLLTYGGYPPDTHWARDLTSARASHTDGSLTTETIQARLTGLAD